MIHRSSEKIYFDMLTIMKKGSNRTHVMYLAKLTYRQLKEYLRDLQSYKWIELIDNVKIPTYKPTKSGERFMSLYEEIIQLKNQ